MAELKYTFAPLPHDTVELNDTLRRISLSLDNVNNRLEDFIGFALKFFSFGAYGGMKMSAPTAVADLGAGWADIAVFDGVTMTPRGMSFDPATDRFAFDYPGVYLLNIGLIFTHNELNAGRETSVRLYDHTAAAGGASALIGTARNVGSSMLAVSFLVQITSDMVGDEFGVQIGGGDAYSSVAFTSAKLEACAVSEWQESSTFIAEGQLQQGGISPVSQPVTDDLRFPATGINLPGQPSDPNMEIDTGLLLFSGNTQQTIAVAAQLPHAWYEGSLIQPHVHWERVTAGAGDVLWRLEYKISRIGEVRDANWSVLDSNTVVASISDDGAADRHLITSLGNIDISGGQISDMLIMRLSRMGGADAYSDDARLLEFDLHILKDSLGSAQPFTKA